MNQAVDETALAEIREMMGEAFADVVAITASTLPEQLDRLLQAVDAADAEVIFNTAHRIKSTAGTIGALGLAKKAEAIEMIGRSGSADVSAALLDEIRRYTAETLEVLQGSL